MKEFLIAYDIKNKKRLSKLARYLQKIGIRIEYSVFYVKASKDEMVEIAIKISEIINQDDDVRIYEILDYGIVLGNGIVLDEVCILK